jgi:hypothetical protein
VEEDGLAPDFVGPELFLKVVCGRRLLDVAADVAGVREAPSVDE